MFTGEAVATARGRVGRERTSPAQIGTPDVAQVHAIALEYLLDPHVRFELFEADPRGRHHAEPHRAPESSSLKWLSYVDKTFTVCPD